MCYDHLYTESVNIVRASHSKRVLHSPTFHAFNQTNPRSLFSRTSKIVIIRTYDEWNQYPLFSLLILERDLLNPKDLLLDNDLDREPPVRILP